MKRGVLAGAASLVLVCAWPALLPCADDTFTLKAGTTLQVRLMTTLNTKTNQNGDPWSGTVEDPIIGHGEEVVPAGSTVEGRVTFVKPPGRATGRAEMRLVAETITTPDGTEYSITAGLEDAQGAAGAKVSGKEGTITGPGKSKKDAAKDAGIGAGVGAGVGAIAAGGTGALYGAGIGAAVVGLRSILKHHKDVVVPQGTELTFVLSRNTTAKKINSSPNQPSASQ